MIKGNKRGIFNGCIAVVVKWIYCLVLVCEGYRVPGHSPISLVSPRSRRIWDFRFVWTACQLRQIMTAPADLSDGRAPDAVLQYHLD